MKNIQTTKLSQNYNLPNFLCIGSQRCASTWLYSVLSSHPQIKMAPKETHFFSNYIKNKNLEWYSNFFKPKQGEQINLVKGEVCPSYAAMFPEEIAFVRELIPNLKIILIIRNPVERLISQMTRVWSYENSLATYNLFSLLRQVDISSSYRRTDYMKIYQNWSHYFGKENIFVETYDNLNNYPNQTIQNILYFLGFNQEFYFQKAVLKDKKNVSKINKKEIPHFLKWYLSKKWLLKVRSFQNQINIDLSSWIESMEKNAAEGKLYYYIIIVIHYIYFVILYTILYKNFNAIRVLFKKYKIRKNLDDQLKDLKTNNNE